MVDAEETVERRGLERYSVEQTLCRCQNRAKGILLQVRAQSLLPLLTYTREHAIQFLNQDKQCTVANKFSAKLSCRTLSGAGRHVIERFNTFREGGIVVFRQHGAENAQ